MEGGRVQPKRLGILIVAYNASSTLAEVLNRIPPEFRTRVSDVLVCDDHSDDATYLVGLGYRQLVPDVRRGDQKDRPVQEP